MPLIAAERKAFHAREAELRQALKDPAYIQFGKINNTLKRSKASLDSQNATYVKSQNTLDKLNRATPVLHNGEDCMQGKDFIMTRSTWLSQKNQLLERVAELEDSCDKLRINIRQQESQLATQYPPGHPFLNREGDLMNATAANKRLGEEHLNYKDILAKKNYLVTQDLKEKEEVLQGNVIVPKEEDKKKVQVPKAQIDFNAIGDRQKSLKSTLRFFKDTTSTEELIQTLGESPDTDRPTAA
jgi:hypothetical protein